jgi:hypothetical protein
MWNPPCHWDTNDIYGISNILQWHVIMELPHYYNFEYIINMLIIISLIRALMHSNELASSTAAAQLT